MMKENMIHPKTSAKFRLWDYQRLSETEWANPVILKNGSEEISIVSVDETPNYPILMSDGERYSINGKNLKNSILTISYNMMCPFISGRLVLDKTFAIRFKSFLENTQVCDAAGEDELEYLKLVAEDLLTWQLLTVEDDNEIQYLKNNKLLPYGPIKETK